MNATPPTILQRILRDIPLKAFGTTFGMTAFFVAYFALLRSPLFPVTFMPTTWLDSVIGFQPWSLVPYCSLWFFIAFLPALLVERRELWSFAGGSAALSLIGLGIFLLWPTAAPAPDIDWSRYPSFQFLKSADASGNACPSLHTAFAVFTALWFARILPGLGAGRLLQAVNLVWAFLIVYSTLATKQHVALDALWGCVLGAWIASLNFILVPESAQIPSLRRPLFVAVAVIKISAVLLWISGIPFGLCLAVFLTGGALILYHIFIPGAGELVRVATRFETSEKEVWLTIDDGPDPDDTPRILDLLDQHRARATFFLIGERIALHPALIAAIRARGHEIGHHTQTHPCASFWCASRARVRRELDKALTVLTAGGQPAPTRFRSPVGFKNLVLAPELTARGLACIAWSIRSGDTLARGPDAVAACIARKLKPGSIILMHEGPPVRPVVRVTAIETVLKLLSARGYRAVIPAPESLR
ncbi:MAG: polysaccharide deacetylase family protein [Rariglobus sp.]|nr:polysaccharide deacetylase family protein [Rariglobus sp.]